VVCWRIILYINPQHNNLIKPTEKIWFVVSYNRKIFQRIEDLVWSMAWNVTDVLVDIQIRNRCCKISQQQSAVKVAWSQLWATLCDDSGLNDVKFERCPAWQILECTSLLRHIFISCFHSTKGNISLWKCEVLLLTYLLIFTSCIATVYSVGLLILLRAEH